jgi:NADPH-dependent 2,4-dienoyl-CoA reductase/sulfur reductase-like enzyme/ferredoxin
MAAAATEAVAPAPRFPNYLQMRRRVPRRVWRIAQWLGVALTLGLLVCLVVAPRTGLIAWWQFIVPLLPLTFLLAPGIWRNVCPMATLNQVPRLLGFTRGRSLPGWLRRHGYVVAVAMYFGFVSLRAPVFDHDGPAVAALLGLALVAAFTGGVIYKGKSGWCGTICPLLPIQKLYGQTPAVVVPNAHCETCVGCQKNCYDFNPRIASVADANDPEPDWVNYRRVFAGTLPGFVVAFFTVPGSVVGAPADLGLSVASYYGLVLGSMAASLGLYMLAEMFTGLSASFLMAVWGMIALNAHNVLGFPGAFHVHKPAPVAWVEGMLVLAASVVFLVRTRAKERELAAIAEDQAPVVLTRPDAAAARDAPASATHTVSFDEGGPTIAAKPGATLLEIAERSRLPIEAGCRMGVCGADPIRIGAGMDALSPMSDDERATLQRLGLAEDCHRMACCARVKGDVGVSLTLDRTRSVAPVAPAAGFDASVEHVVIVGNGIAGMTAADHVRRRHPDCSIDVVADELHPLYNRMGISRLVYGRSAMQGLHLLPDSWYDERRVTTWLNTQASRIDRERRVLRLATGDELPFDRLILATGSAARVPGMAGLDREGVFVLRSANDAIGVRGYVQRSAARRALVIGGGLLGLEAAHALRELGLRVTVVQRGNRLMRDQLDTTASDMLARYLRALGLEIVCDASPVALTGNGSVGGVQLDDDREMPADVVLICAGIVPHVELARDAGLDVARGILVDETMHTSDPEILAAGDCAEFGGAIYGLWPTAVEQAEIAAINAVADEHRSYAHKLPVALLKGIGLHLLSLGVVEPAEGDETIVDAGDGRSVTYRKLVIRNGRVVGGVLVGHESDAPALTIAVRDRVDVSARLEELRRDPGLLAELVG